MYILHITRSDRGQGDRHVTIPATPFLIICEPSLVPMWEQECLRFFMWGITNIVVWESQSNLDKVKASIKSSSTENLVIIMSSVGALFQY